MEGFGQERKKKKEKESERKKALATHGRALNLIRELSEGSPERPRARATLPLGALSRG